MEIERGEVLNFRGFAANSASDPKTDVAAEVTRMRNCGTHEFHPSGIHFPCWNLLRPVEKSATISNQRPSGAIRRLGMNCKARALAAAISFSDNRSPRVVRMSLAFLLPWFAASSSHL